MKDKTTAFKQKLIPLMLLFFALLAMEYLPAKTSVPGDLRNNEPGLNKDFQTALDSLIHQYNFPGATAAYVLPDGTTYAFATGFSDRESGIEMTAGSRMLAASIGKSFVGATLTSLHIEGVINLDAPLAQYLGDRPWFSRLPNNHQITLRHLLTHSSGLPDHVYQEEFAAEVSRKWKQKDNPFLPEDLIRFILDSPPLFEAGKGWAYSDTNYILLGLVIEEVTGKNVFDIITERFLLPLNLTMTCPSNSRYIKNMAAGYMPEDNVFGFPAKTTSSEGELFWHPGFEWTGG
ncbi:MAG: serine hydrolase domain-containing protein, partial [Bacteroidales bacterium]